MIGKVSEVYNGVKIWSHTISSVMQYADDVLLLSLTASGLQKLIDNADTYVARHSLSFKAHKSVCAVYRYGKRKCYNTKWYIKGEPIKRENGVKYLGVLLSSIIPIQAFG